MATLALAEALEIGLAWRHETNVAIVHVMPGSTVATSASVMVVAADGRVDGELPASVTKAALEAARDMFDRGQSRVYSLTPDPDGGRIVGIEGGDVDIFVELLTRPAEMVIVGAGHVAQPLAVIGSQLGWSITVIDDRPDFANKTRFPTAGTILAQDFVEGLRTLRLEGHSFVVLVTRGHVHDADCLRHVLATSAGYIGMIGSKRRIRTVLAALRDDGFTDQQLSRVYGPIGLDIGSHTPAEIAVAIAAEIIDVYRGGRSPHLRLRTGDV